MALTYASTFAGIGGFDLAFDRAGMKCTAQVEIEPNRQKVLARHWPDVPRGGDVRSVNGTDLGNPDVIVGGFPCTDLSIGKARGKGLAGPESGLYWEFHRLVDEHLRLVDAARPRFTVLENVGNLTRTNGGRDLAAVVLGLEQLGYGWAYRVVDSRAVGSAQRRPRILIVGHRGGDPRPALAVLADRDTDGWGAGVRREPVGDVRPAFRDVAEGSEPIIFRKRANPRAKASAGGWASYEQGTYLNTLTNNDSGSNVRQKHIVYQDGRLRALTPVEWERAQGFPDGWTEGIPDRHRFLALGDALNVHTGTWLAKRLVEVAESVPLLDKVVA
jgi:DNA (cytosine-5)-methyltransferase 1